MDRAVICIVEYDIKYAKEISSLIIRNLKEVNSKDYPISEIEALAERFSEVNIDNLLRDRKVFVAVWNEKAIGTLSVVNKRGGEVFDYIFLTIFVNPDFHRRGIGKKLMYEGETYVKGLQGKTISIPSSITSSEFYVRMGYEYIEGIKKLDDSGHYWMVKKI
ncbi:MAG: GNAT family N-acetyltransferase [Firmicutes bacterium HGW-Firmicutes-1]|jgi:GNAT superfamily N-acetyltransferase|nr:MAG: GNAT family N-acetyltransferase [Firmicutes bacterium HGW-Firmicutes-1]